MSNAPLIKNAVLVSLHGDQYGIDASGYTTGKNYKGHRIATYGSTASPLLAGQGWARNEFRHNEVFEDFTGKTLSTKFQYLHGSDGTAAAAVSVAKGGVVLLTSGDGGTHTMAVNGAQLTHELNWYAGNGALMMEARVKVSALTSQAFFIGFTDNAALEMPATLATATYTTNADDAVGFVQDSEGTNTHLNLIGVKATVDATATALTADLTTSYKVFRIELDTSGNATCFIDGAQVGTVTSAVTPTVALTPTVAMFSHATSGTQTASVDYIACSQLRV